MAIPYDFVSTPEGITLVLYTAYVCKLHCRNAWPCNVLCRFYKSIYRIRLGGYHFLIAKVVRQVLLRLKDDSGINGEHFLLRVHCG